MSEQSLNLWLIAVLFAAGLFAIATGMVRTALESKRLSPWRGAGATVAFPRWHRWMKRLPLASASVAAAALVAIFSLTAHLDRKRIRELTRICSTSNARVTITRYGSRIELSGPDSRAFLTLLAGGKDVSAHHTHPVGLHFIEIEAGEMYRYYLARDSERDDEFWLKKEEETPGIEHAVKVRQFQSAELSDFLKTQVAPITGGP